jgi:predicted GIY-YIG superfamily endonuclease
MGKHWVYILVNEAWEEEDETIYVGETMRLYRRFDEHLNGRGCKNTQHFGNYGSVRLVGLYNVSQNDAFEEYHSRVETFEEWYSVWDLKWKFKHWRERVEQNGLSDKQECDFLMIENLITEMCIYLHKDCDIDVKGGKYTKEACYKDQMKSYPTHRPICHCGYPAEVFLSKKNEVWFKCAVANATWVEYENDCFCVAEPCSFLQKYDGDMKLRQKLRTLENREASDVVKRLPKLVHKAGCDMKWLQELPCTVCKSEKYSPVFNRGFRALCTKCIDERFEEVRTTNTTPKYEFLPDSDEEI